MDSMHQKYQSEIANFKNMDVEEIDNLIFPSRCTPRLPRDEVVSAFKFETQRLSKEIAEECHIEKGVPYGNSERQCFDVIPNSSTNGPLVVFFHGGYWIALNREEFYHIGKPLMKNGITFITVGYELAPEVTMTEIVKQCTTAVEAIIKIAKGSDCKGIYLTGHSAGGHLAIMSACFVNSLHEMAHLIKGFIFFSGVFDLHPVQLSSHNKILQMTDEEADKYSPLNPDCIAKINKYFSHCKFLVVVPEYDAPEFLRQGECFNEKLLNYGLQSELLHLNGKDHFDYIQELADENDLATKILDFITSP